MEIRQAISMYLTAKAYNEPDFKTKFENPNKNLDECVKYITYKMYCKVKDEQEQHSSMAVCVPSDDEIFALAEQYYTDEDLKVEGDSLSSVRVVSMAATTFTDEEKEQMRKDAIAQYQAEVIADAKKKDEEKKAKKTAKKSSPVMIPDAPKDNNSASTSNDTPDKQENTQAAVQMDLFGNTL